MVAAQNDRARHLVSRAKDGLIDLEAHTGNVFHIPLMRIAWPFGFGNRGGDVALVNDYALEGSQLLAQTGDAEGGWAHIGAAPVAAEIERHADEMDRGKGHQWPRLYRAVWVAQHRRRCGFLAFLG